MYIAIKQIGKDVYDVIECNQNITYGKVVATFTDWNDAEFFINWKEKKSYEAY